MSAAVSESLMARALRGDYMACEELADSYAKEGNLSQAVIWYARATSVICRPPKDELQVQTLAKCDKFLSEVKLDGPLTPLIAMEISEVLYAMYKGEKSYSRLQNENSNFVGNLCEGSIANLSPEDLDSISETLYGYTNGCNTQSHNSIKRLLVTKSKAEAVDGRIAEAKLRRRINFFMGKEGIILEDDYELSRDNKGKLICEFEAPKMAATRDLAKEGEQRVFMGKMAALMGKTEYFTYNSKESGGDKFQFVVNWEAIEKYFDERPAPQPTSYVPPIFVPAPKTVASDAAARKLPQASSQAAKIEGK